MSSIRSILVHADAGPRAEERLRIAGAIAQEHAGARLAALYLTSPGYVDSLYGYAPSGVAVEMLQQAERAQRQAAREHFKRVLGEKAFAAWFELAEHPLLTGLVEQALYADLVVVGQRDPDEPQATWWPADFVETVVFGAGKPTLVVPYAGRYDRVGDSVMVAWKPTRECARAVAGALPLLRRARAVHVAMWAGEPAPRRDDALDIVSYLQLHGVDAELHLHAGEPQDPGPLLLSSAYDAGCDLLVMGCYGHSRLREFVLGGASRSVLKSMTLPVLMAH